MMCSSCSHHHSPVLVNAVSIVFRAIYVRNIAPDASEQEISGHFSKFGAIVKIRLFKRGLLSSFGFVEFEDHAEAVQAIVHSDGKELHGRVIRCCWSKQQPGGSMPMPGAQLPAPPSDLAFTNATATAASSLSALSGVNPWLLGSNAAPPPNPSNFALLAAAASLPGGGHSMWQHGHSGMQAQSTAASLGMQHRDATSAFMPGSLFSMHPSSLATALGAASQQARICMGSQYSKLVPLQRGGIIGKPAQRLHDSFFNPILVHRLSTGTPWQRS